MANQKISLEDIPRQPEEHLDILAEKVRVIGEYLVVSDPGDLIGMDGDCEYYNIGEILYRIGLKLGEIAGVRKPEHRDA